MPESSKSSRARPSVVILPNTHVSETRHYAIRNGQVRSSYTDIEPLVAVARDEVTKILSSGKSNTNRQAAYTKLYNDQIAPHHRTLKKMQTELAACRTLAIDQKNTGWLVELLRLIEHKKLLQEQLKGDMDRARRVLNFTMPDNPNHFYMQDNVIKGARVEELHGSIAKHQLALNRIEAFTKPPLLKWQDFVNYQKLQIQKDLDTLSKRARDMEEALQAAASQENILMMNRIAKCLDHHRRLFDQLDDICRSAASRLQDAIRHTL